MSERGVVCSNYFYCTPCARVTEVVFRDYYEYVTLVMVPAQLSASGKSYPIVVVGKSRVGYPGEDFAEFEERVAPELADALCHSARFAIMSDSDDSAFAVVEPNVRRASPVIPKRLGGA